MILLLYCSGFHLGYCDFDIRLTKIMNENKNYIVTTEAEFISSLNSLGH